MIPDATFTLDKAKAHLRVDHANEDALITGFLDSAVGAVERFTRRAWTEREWVTRVDACDLATCSCDDPAVWHALLSPATAEITHGEPPVAIPSTDFYYSSRWGGTVLHVTAWPTSGEKGVVGSITWSAEPDGEVPPEVYAAVMLVLGDLYENREGAFVGISASTNPFLAQLLAPWVIDLHA